MANKIVVTMDPDALGKVLSGFNGLNKGGHPDNTLTGTEISRLVPFLLDNQNDFVSATDKVAAPARPMWVSIDRESGLVEINKMKTPLVEAWTQRHDVNKKKRNVAKVDKNGQPVTSTKNDAEPGEIAYVYSYQAGLMAAITLLVIREDFLRVHLKDDDDFNKVMAEVTRLHAGSGESEESGENGEEQNAA